MGGSLNARATSIDDGAENTSRVGPCCSSRPWNSTLVYPPSCSASWGSVVAYTTVVRPWSNSAPSSSRSSSRSL